MTDWQQFRKISSGILGRSAGSWIGLGLVVWLVPSAAHALLCTAQTPEQAVRQWQRAQGTGVQISAEEWARPLGYAVLRIVHDPISGQVWAQVQDCAHLSRPLVAIALPEHAATSKTSALKNSATDAEASDPAMASRAFAAQMQRASLPQLPAYTPQAVRRARPQEVAPSQTEQTYSTAAPVLVRAGDRVTLWNQEPDLQMSIAAVALEYGRAGQVIHLRSTSGFASKTETIAGVVRAAGSVELLP